MTPNRALPALIKLCGLMTDADHDQLTGVENELATSFPYSRISTPVGEMSGKYLTFTSLPWVLGSKEPRVKVEELWQPTLQATASLVDRLVVPNGNLAPHFLFIGIAPRDAGPLPPGSFTRAWTSGPSSLMLKKALSFSGLLEFSAFTNILKCPTPGNRKPKPREVERHRSVLLNEITLLAPKYIVVLGVDAEHFMPDSDVPRVKVPHPSWAVRTGLDPSTYGTMIRLALKKVR